MRVDLLTREYPPEVYGGAGVHVGELLRELRKDLDVVVRCFGAERPEPNVFPYLVPAELVGANPALATLGVDLQMAQDVAGASIAHSHTWYANGAGRLAQLLHDIPHVVTAHSLEPLRPWKSDQLGGGYRISREIEKTAFTTADAIIAVSSGMREDILRCYPRLDESKISVVHNGVDLERWRPTIDEDAARRIGIDLARPAVVFVGRITRQKGLIYLLEAAKSLSPDVQLVLCAGSPDTSEILAEVGAKVEELQQERSGVVWLNRLVQHDELVTVLSAATVFVCPSIYEPLGIVNLEAMACGIPVVGTATGGIPEVIEDGVTGRLVHIDQRDDGSGTPRNPEKFVSDLSAAIVDILSDPVRARMMGQAGRTRVEREFSWAKIASDTRAVYDTLL